MPLTIPDLDGRKYGDLVEEALARIPVHNPEWTNFNDSDPGVTLVHLFAFMADTLLYRANRIPERSRLKFLQLLGIPLQAASAARGVITIANDRGPLETVTLLDGLPVQAGALKFVTRNALDVLPVQSRLFVRRSLSPAEIADAQTRYDVLYGIYRNDTTALEFYKTTPIEPPSATAGVPIISLDQSTVDNSLWIALLARPREDARTARAKIAGRTLTLGLMPAVDETARTLRPGGDVAPEAAPPLVYEISTGALTTAGVPIYAPLENRADANPLDELTLVQLTLPDNMGVWDDLEPLQDGVGDFPPALDDQDTRSRVVAWLRIGLKSTASQSALKVRFSWVGINAARVDQRAMVQGEQVADGTGEPDQTFVLANRPVITPVLSASPARAQGDAEDTVHLMVNGEPWTRVDDLLAAPPEVPVRDVSSKPGTRLRSGGDPRVFTVDRESGEVRFGDGLRGARPRGRIVASYAYGGGQAGNVGIGAIATAPSLPAGFAVANPLPTWGGGEGETTAQGERAIAQYIRHRDRAVTPDDFSDIVWRTPGIELGRVDVLPLYHPTLGSPSPGVVTLLVVPDDPRRPEAPEPDHLFLEAICRYLEPRRLITTEVHVRGPEYLPIWVSVGIDVVPGYDIAPVREAVKNAVATFLSPTVGGFETKDHATGQGWPLGKQVEDREVYARVTREQGIAKVRDVLLFDGKGARQTQIPITGLQLPYLQRLNISIGDAEDLSTLVSGPPDPGPIKRVPVPILPEEC
jgi:Baseplate J-like protein